LRSIGLSFFKKRLNAKSRRARKSLATALMAGGVSPPLLRGRYECPSMGHEDRSLTNPRSSRLPPRGGLSASSGARSHDGDERRSVQKPRPPYEHPPPGCPIRYLSRGVKPWGWVPGGGAARGARAGRSAGAYGRVPHQSDHQRFESSFMIFAVNTKIVTGSFMATRTHFHLYH